MSRVLGIGVDLTQMPRMRRVVARWDERFLQRVFTEEEIAYCRRRRDPIPHFAARFAAKEATLKALGTGLRMGVNWRELEVRRERGQALRRETDCQRDRIASRRLTGFDALTPITEQWRADHLCGHFGKLLAHAH